MNVLRVVWQRVFMFLFYKATYLMNWRIPELIEGNDSVKLIPNKSGAKSSQVRKDIPIFIYDENGKRALNIAKAYVKAGAEMVYYLKGGYQSFIKGEDDVK